MKNIQENFKSFSHSSHSYGILKTPVFSIKLFPNERLFLKTEQQKVEKTPLYQEIIEKYFLIRKFRSKINFVFLNSLTPLEEGVHQSSANTFISKYFQSSIYYSLFFDSSSPFSEKQQRSVSNSFFNRYFNQIQTSFFASNYSFFNLDKFQKFLNTTTSKNRLKQFKFSSSYKPSVFETINFFEHHSKLNQEATFAKDLTINKYSRELFLKFSKNYTQLWNLNKSHLKSFFHNPVYKSKTIFLSSEKIKPNFLETYALAKDFISQDTIRNILLGPKKMDFSIFKQFFSEKSFSRIFFNSIPSFSPKSQKNTFLSEPKNLEFPIFKFLKNFIAPSKKTPFVANNFLIKHSFSNGVNQFFFKKNALLNNLQPFFTQQQFMTEKINNSTSGIFRHQAIDRHLISKNKIFEGETIRFLQNVEGNLKDFSLIKQQYKSSKKGKEYFSNKFFQNFAIGIPFVSSNMNLKEFSARNTNFLNFSLKNNAYRLILKHNNHSAERETIVSNVFNKLKRITSKTKIENKITNLNPDQENLKFTLLGGDKESKNQERTHDFLDRKMRQNVSIVYRESPTLSQKKSIDFGQDVSSTNNVFSSTLKETKVVENFSSPSGEVKAYTTREINTIANKVYKMLEKKILIEKEKEED